MKNIDLLYQILLAVKNSRTISDLADRLFMSQPYISQVISRAEKKYDTTLIKRSPLPIDLTEAGSTLLYDLGNLINMDNDLLVDMAQYGKKREHFVSLGFDQPLLTVQATSIIKTLRKSYPAVNFRIYELPMSMADRRLQIKKTDIIDGRMENNSEFNYDIVHREKLCLIVTKRSKLYDVKTSEVNLNTKLLNKLNNESFISRERGYFQPLIDQMFRKHGVTIKPTIKLDNSITITQMAKAGLGNAITFNKLVGNNKKTSEYRVFQIPSSFLNFDLGIAYRKRTTTLIKKIAQSMIKIINSENV